METPEPRLRAAEREATGDPVTLGRLAQRPSVEGAVAAMREFLGMEVAFTGEFVADEQVFRVLRGDGESFGIEEGGRMALGQTYCERVLTGRLPNIIANVRSDERASSLPITAAADVGAFVSVPLKLSDGRFYGTLCAASHQAMPSLGYRELQFLHVFARIVADQLEQERALEARVELELQSATAQALVAAVEARDSYTAEHSRAVVEQATAVGQELGLSGPELTEVGQVALLHDIGKIAIPDQILGKTAPLNEEEWRVMCCHPVYSERLICEVPELAHLGPAIRAEHEHWDGSGYPDGLRGEEIPLASRIILVCDAYHAMTSDRPYRAAMEPPGPREEIEANLGGQFCPSAGAALLRVLAHQ